MVKRLCTFSIRSMSCFRCGDQTTQLYSSILQTRHIIQQQLRKTFDPFVRRAVCMAYCIGVMFSALDTQSSGRAMGSTPARFTFMQSCSLITVCKFSQPCFCHWTASSAGAGHFSSSDPSQSTGGGASPVPKSIQGLTPSWFHSTGLRVGQLWEALFHVRKAAHAKQNLITNKIQ